MSRIRFRERLALPALLCLPLLLSACAATSVRVCKDIAGPGWSVLSQPPPNAAKLMMMQGANDGGELVWLAKGRDQVLACHYRSGMVSPGCSDSRAYAFERKSGRWIPKGVLISACNAEQ